MSYHVGHFAPHAWLYSTQSLDAVKGRPAHKDGQLRKNGGFQTVDRI
jgi:hypothetical protein